MMDASRVDMQKVEEMLAKRRAEAFEKATKIPAAEYTGWVSWPGCGDDDGYFESVQELLNHCAKTGKPTPAFVWACTPMSLHLDAEGIVDQALEEHHEGARDFISNAEMERLQTLLDEWAKAQGLTSWCEDRTRALMFGKESSKGHECTCGSGAHPRHCAMHPENYYKHVTELQAENEKDWCTTCSGSTDVECVTCKGSGLKA